MKNVLRLFASAFLFSVMAPLLPAQTLTILHGFGSSDTDGINPHASLILSGSTLYGTTGNGGSTHDGTVFSINTNGTGYTTLYSFTGGDDGVLPQGALVLSGTNLFGVTALGGSSGNGTIFRIGTNGAGFTTLHSFTSASDGSYPLGGLVLSGTNLYGVAINGGPSDNGTVFSVSTNGEDFKTLYSFTGGTDGASPQGRLLLIGTNLYGTAVNGGFHDVGTIFKVSTGGIGFTALYSFSELGIGTGTNNDGAEPTAGLTLVGNMLYGTASEGGTQGYGTIFGISTNGSGFVTVHSFTSLLNNANDDGGEPSADLILVGTNLYGTTPAGGVLGGGVVFSFNTNGTDLNVFYDFDGAIASVPATGLIFTNGAFYGTTSGGGGGGGSDGTVFSLLLAPPVPPVIYSITNNAGAITLSVTGAPGSINRVWTTTNLSLPMDQWQLADTNVATNGYFQFTDTNVAGAKYYRVSTP